MLNAVRPDLRKQVSNLLQWLAFSLEPLTVGELAEIFILDYSSLTQFDDDDRLSYPGEVLRHLSGLVVVLTESDDNHDEIEGASDSTLIHPSREVRLAHFSIKEYLVSPRIRRQSATEFHLIQRNAHLRIAGMSLAYHLCISETHLATEDNQSRFALWRYASKFWVKHLEMVELESWPPCVLLKAVQAFAPASNVLLNTARISDSDFLFRHERDGWSLSHDQVQSPLFYTASMGALRMTSVLLQHCPDVDSTGAKNASYITPFFEAINYRHLAIAQLLAERGANVNVNYHNTNYNNIFPLHEAANRGEIDVVRFLIDCGADVNFEGGYYGTALQAATLSPQLDIIEFLLINKADINIQGGFYSTALQAAATNGHVEIAKLLIANGADVNIRDKEYGTALGAALREGNIEIAKLLIDNGASFLDTWKAPFDSLLQEAVCMGQEQATQLLLDSGADPNAQVEGDGNLLQSSVLWNQKETFKILVNGGADLNMKGGPFETLLQTAAYYEQLEIIKILLQHGADVNACGGVYGNALQAAASNGCHGDTAETIQLLCLKGATLMEPGQEFEELLDKIRSYEGSYNADRRINPLQKLRDDPEGCLKLGMANISQVRQQRQDAWDEEEANSYYKIS